MSDQKPNPIDLVGAWLNNSRPPIQATLQDGLAVASAWNEIAKRLIELDAPKASEVK